MVCEFRPDFDPATWAGSDLMAKMQVVPVAFVGAQLYGEQPFVTGCGMDLWHAPAFDEEQAELVERCPRALRSKLSKASQKFFFTTSMGRSPEGWRFQLFSAATLAQVTDGVYFDPQAGQFLTGVEAVRVAAELAALTESGRASRLRLRPFKTWRAALKDAVPEYSEAELDT